MWRNKKKKWRPCEGTMLANLFVANIPQYTCVSNHHIIHVKLQNILCQLYINKSGGWLKKKKQNMAQTKKGKHHLLLAFKLLKLYIYLSFTWERFVKSLLPKKKKKCTKPLKSLGLFWSCHIRHSPRILKVAAISSSPVPCLLLWQQEVTSVLRRPDQLKQLLKSP